MSLNLCKDTKFGLESKYDIRADSLRVDGLCTAYGDEALISNKNIPNTKVLTFRVDENTGSNDYCVWSWAVEGTNFTCNVTMNPQYTPNAGYCVFQSIEPRVGDVDLVRPAGIVKISANQFGVGFFSQTTGLLDKNAFKLIIVGTFPVV